MLVYLADEYIPSSLHLTNNATSGAKDDWGRVATVPALHRRRHDQRTAVLQRLDQSEQQSQFRHPLADSRTVRQRSSNTADPQLPVSSTHRTYTCSQCRRGLQQ